MSRPTLSCRACGLPLGKVTDHDQLVVSDSVTDAQRLGPGATLGERRWRLRCRCGAWREFAGRGIRWPHSLAVTDAPRGVPLEAPAS